MSLDKLLRDVVREEVARAMGPLSDALGKLQAQSAIVSRLGDAFGVRVKGPVAKAPKAVKVVKGGKRGKAAESDGARACALEDCGRPARSKGYCAAHYQKYRMLQKTGRLPSDWVEFAPVGSVKNLTLPRGRAGAKALAEAKKKN
jgi:hypothetical protein